MSWLKRLFGRSEVLESFIHFDFRSKFPHIFWTSSWTQAADSEPPVQLKVFSARLEPSGDFEVVVTARYRDGSKEKLQHWTVKRELFDRGQPLIQDLETGFGVKFDVLDLSRFATAESFEAEAKRLGWEVT